MSENIYFQRALAKMTAGAAYVDAVRHMYDSGMSAEEIQKICHILSQLKKWSVQ